MTVASSTSPRERMVDQQIAARGIRDEQVLRAMTEVPREEFVPGQMREFAYEDSPLPIAAGQTISQPYVVALMVEALELGPDDRVIEVGSGSGYAAAVMSRICQHVYGIERHAELAKSSRRALEELGYDNVEILHGDGTLGWPEQAPFHAILVSAGGPAIPDALREQLGVGGRIVIPVGGRGRLQNLVRGTRLSIDKFRVDDMGPVAFVPLIGAQGWRDEMAETRWPVTPAAVPVSPQAPAAEAAPAPAPVTPAELAPAAQAAAIRATEALEQKIAHASEPFDDPDRADLGPLIERIGDRRLVLIGEASHGTAEFYRLRARITKALIEQRGFTIVAVEADWPDAARIDRWVRCIRSDPGSG